MTEVKRGKTSDGQVRQGFACMFVFSLCIFFMRLRGRGGGGFFLCFFLKGGVNLRSTFGV